MRDYSVSSIIKAAAILEYLKVHKSSTFSQIQSDLSYAKSSAYQILKTLENLKMVSVNQYGEYSLGYKLFEWGCAFGRGIDLRNVAGPCIREIAEESGLTVHLSILTKDCEGICIEKIPGKVFTMQLTNVGVPLKMNTSASGKVLLAWQTPEVQARALEKIPYTPFTERSFVTKEGLAAELLQVRRQGYAYDEQESEQNCRGVGVPLFACDGTFLASVSIGAPLMMMAPEEMPHYVKILQTHLEKLSPRLAPNRIDL